MSSARAWSAVVLALVSCGAPAVAPTPAAAGDPFAAARSSLAALAERPGFLRCTTTEEATAPLLLFLRARAADPAAITLWHFAADCDRDHPAAAGALRVDLRLLVRAGDPRLHDAWDPADLVAFAAAERLVLPSEADVRVLLRADEDPLVTIAPEGHDGRRWRIERAYSGRDLPPEVLVLVIDAAGVPERLEAPER